MTQFFLPFIFILIYGFGYFLSRRRRIHSTLLPDSRILLQRELKTENSAVKKLSFKIEQLFFSGRIGARVKNIYVKASLPEELSLGYLILFTVGFLWVVFQLALLFKLSISFSFLGALLTEGVTLVFISRNKRSITQFEASLPQFFETMARTYRMYPDLTTALKEAQKTSSNGQLHGVIVEALHLISLGYTPLKALEKVAKNTRSENFTYVVSVIGLQLTTGADVPFFLENTAKKIRQQEATKHEIAQILFQNKVSAILCAGLPIILLGASLIVSTNYRTLLLFASEGRVILCAALFWWLLGVLVTYRALRIRI